MATTFKKISNNGQTTLLSSILIGATSLQIQLADTGKFPASGNFWVNVYLSATPAIYETMLVTNVSSNTWTVTRAQDSTSAVAWSAGAVIELPIRVEHVTDLNTAVNTIENKIDGTTDPSLVILKKPTISNIKGGGSNTNGHTVPNLTDDTFTLNGAAQTLTNKIITDSTNLISFNSPDSFMINGRIQTSVASNNLTAAIKGLNGSDPSATNPVYFRINNTIRTLTSALSVTLNAGTNYFNSGSTELATKEVDYFVYIFWKASDSSVVMGFSRLPSLFTYADASSTNTAFNYLAVSAAPASTDQGIIIGRFNATLSATASFNWSIPATSIIIQRPIYETRWLTWQPVYTASGSMTFTSVTTNAAMYRLFGSPGSGSAHVGFDVIGTTGGSASTEIRVSTPISVVAPYNGISIGCGYNGDSGYLGGLQPSTSGYISCLRVSGGNYALAAGKQVTGLIVYRYA